jgi:hypothetical protein
MPQDADKPTYTSQELQQRCDWLLDKTSIVDSDGRYLKAIWDIVEDMHEAYTIKDWLELIHTLGGNGYLHQLAKDEEDLQEESRLEGR